MEPTEQSNTPPAVEKLPSSAKENLRLLENFQDHEEQDVSGMQLAIERVSSFFGSPAYFVCAIAVIALWVIINSYGAHHGWQHIDAPPFSWLQGLISFNALLLTVAVLIRQNRMAKVAEHRSHLDLHINLLSEQKVTKILQLVHELQRELTALRGAPDKEVQEMSKPADAHALMHAIKQNKDERDR